MTVTYFPILKAKQGELQALAKWDASWRPHVHPVVEAVPWERDVASDADPVVADEQAEAAEIAKLADRLAKSWISDSVTAFVDVASAEYDLAGSAQSWQDIEPVLSRLMKQLATRRVRVAPVIRASVEEGYLVRVRSELEASAPLREAVVRVTAEDLDDAVTPLNVLTRRAAEVLGLGPQQVDVILDFGALADEEAAVLATRLGRFVLPTLASVPWRSLVVAGGAFPVNLSSVQAYDVERIPRNDLRLWRNLLQLRLEGGMALNFGDYAVTHPALPVGTPFAAPPQLRYAQSDSWIVSKGRRQDRRGHAQFFDVCRTVLRSAGDGASPWDASWGDAYIADAAALAEGRAPRESRGTGNAATWRAIATSQHLAYTADQLAEGDVS